MSHADRLTVYQTLLAEGLLPLFYHAELEQAKAVVAALAEGGCHLVEFTNRGPFALETFAGLVKHCAQSHPQMMIGVGSLQDAPTAALFAAYGAAFVVSPIFSEEIARLCNRRKLAYLPGCGSLQEIALAEEWGAEIVKAFPGEAIGGPAFIKAVLGPRPWSKIMPTGGVSPDEANLAAWFGAGVACVGIGSQLIRPDWLANQDYQAISALTQRTLGTIQTLRSPG
jgi:2-dehydro-3-deoxyphosphogluconate aldolase/(4S)-4-hydroxy-2-oxoglutarate aldolase